MKKSPLSRFNGNRSYGHSPYRRQQFPNINQDNNYQGGNPRDDLNSHSIGGSDFIPFQSSSPISQGNNSWNSQGSGESYSTGFKNNRNNFYNSPGFYKNSSRQCGEQSYAKKNFGRSTQIKVDIFEYLDFDAFFENPWASLEQHLNSANPQNGSKTFDDNSTEDSKVERSSLGRNSLSDTLADKTIDNSDWSEESKPTPGDL